MSGGRALGRIRPRQGLRFSGGLGCRSRWRGGLPGDGRRGGRFCNPSSLGRRRSTSGLRTPCAFRGGRRARNPSGSPGLTRNLGDILALHRPGCLWSLRLIDEPGNLTRRKQVDHQGRGSWEVGGRDLGLPEEGRREQVQDEGSSERSVKKNALLPRHLLSPMRPVILQPPAVVASSSLHPATTHGRA